MHKDQLDENRDDDRGEAIGGVKSAETVGQVLRALREGRGPQTLKEISVNANMHPAKAHRYLVSLCRIGLVDRDEGQTKYRWGELAVSIGAAAIRSLDIVSIGGATARKIRDELDVSVAIAVWADRGPIHVRVEEPARAVIVRSQLGVPLPLLSSATGRVFAGFSREAKVASVRKAEMRKLVTGSPDGATAAKAKIEAVLEIVRADGVATSLGDFSPGINALSCPVFNFTGELVGAITILAPVGELDAAAGKEAVGLLKREAAILSKTLGYDEADISRNST